MNIDERLDRLVERHEALTHSLELLSLETEKHDKQIERNSQQIEKHSQQIGQLVALWQDVAQSIARLAHISEMHPHRLDSHDDRLDKLEGDNA